MVKNPLANAGDIRDLDLIPGLGKIPRNRAWQPIPVLLPGDSHGQRNLVGYSPWHHKDLDTTEVSSTRTHTHTHTHTHMRMWYLYMLVDCIANT